MPKIRLLPPEAAARIAAGEVIERPASLVRELVENAVDAAAGSIEVSVESAGKALVAVRDDGSGIEPGDLDRLFQRHATSKIGGADDLGAVRTLGFRGEALYSVAAVADVILRSRASGEESGWEIHQRGGVRLDKRPAGMSPGTEIEVRELFFNTPARRKFLKSDAAEMKGILGAFIPYALLYPGRRFLLERDGRPLLRLPPCGGSRERAASALNLPAENILETGEIPCGPGTAFRLLAGDINIQRARGDLQFLFVNGRPVQGGTLGFMVNKAFRALLPPGVSPFFILSLTVPPETVDVNIHPAKREVKIRDENRLAGAVFNACRALLAESGRPRAVGAVEPAPRPAPGSSPGTGSRPEGVARVESPAPAGPSAPAGEWYGGAGPAPAGGSGAVRDEAAGRPGGEGLCEKLAQSRYLGHLRNRYLLFAAPFSLLVVDQHAAHERIAYERLKEQLSAGSVTVQRLLMPVLVRLSPPEKVAWEAGREALEAVGFITGAWDDDHLAVHGHPALISGVERAVRGLLAGGSPVRWSEENLARRACRGAVPAGEALSATEADALRRALAGCRDPLICPHGRPTVVEVSEKTLDRYFRR